MRSLLLLLALAGPAAAQQPASEAAVLTFHFVRAGLPVPEYTLSVREDGSGTYAATYAEPAGGNAAYPADYSARATPGQMNRPIVLSHGTTARMFERVRNADHLRNCESREKNVADTGAKTLTYTAADTTLTCTYNFTENKAVAALTETFQGIAQTLDAGRTIEFKHRFDRLGLDKELSYLTEEVQSGRALEVATIAPVLQSLCDDQQVMERVRRRAAGLLQTSASVR